jgi:hypothetical protein
VQVRPLAADRRAFEHRRVAARHRRVQGHPPRVDYRQQADWLRVPDYCAGDSDRLGADRRPEAGCHRNALDLQEIDCRPVV